MRLAQILDAGRPHADTSGSQLWASWVLFLCSALWWCRVYPSSWRLTERARRCPSDNVHAHSVSPPEFPAAVVIPRPRCGPASHNRFKKTPRPLPGMVSDTGLNIKKRTLTHCRQVIAARWSTDAEPSLVGMTCGSERDVVPVSETLLVVRTTQQRGTEFVGVERQRVAHKLGAHADRSGRNWRSCQKDVAKFFCQQQLNN